MYHQLATLKRWMGDDEAAAFADKEAKRLAKKFVTELDRVGTWAVYEEDAVEIFATPTPDDVSTYFGYEMNINGALLDYIAFGGGAEWTKNIHPPWQSEGVQIATTYDGTLNDHTDTDEGWVLEIAIPLANFRHLGGAIPPGDGDLWRLNLNRTKGDKGQFRMWSDSHAPAPAFHHSAFFGKAYFSGAKVRK